jgi:hypothetical protein
LPTAKTKKATLKVIYWDYFSSAHSGALCIF